MRKRRIPKVSGISVNKVIPNLITLAALCFGVSGIRFAIYEQWEFAVSSILIAAALDGIDGRMARFLKAESKFGEQLDSLSDAVSFGVAPSMILYLYILESNKNIGWAIALLLTVCCCMRLARFNSLLGNLPPYAYNYFQGVPAPMGAMLALLPMILEFAYDLPIGDYKELSFIWVAAVALLMVSIIPTFSFKQFKVSYRWGLALVIFIAIALALLFSNPWKLLGVLCVLYVCLMPVSAYRYRLLRLEALRLRGE